jgi:hypothetical protein
MSLAAVEELLGDVLYVVHAKISQTAEAMVQTAEQAYV